MSSRCIGRSSARSASISAIAASWSGVGSKGSRSVSHSRLRVRLVGQRLGVRERAPLRARRRSWTAWSTSSSSKASRRRPRLAVADVRRRDRVGDARAGARAAAAARAAARGRRGRRARCSRTSARICVEVMPFVAGYVRGRLPDRGDRLGGRVVVDPEAPAGLVLAGQHQPRARPVVALEPRLVEERRLHHAGGVGDRRRRRAASCRGGAPDASGSSGPRRGPWPSRPRASVATVRASPASRGRWRSRSPTVCSPSASAASAAFGPPGTSSGLRSRSSAAGDGQCRADRTVAADRASTRPR